MLGSAKRTAVGSFLRISWRDRLALAEAAAWLGIARLAVRLVPFRRLAPLLGKSMAESPENEPRAADLGSRTAWAVRIASRYTPWTNPCLAEAMAAQAMLRLRGVPSTLYLGLAKDETGKLEAHAWLRCGSRILTGGATSDAFTVVAKFAGAGPE